jgi:hypothetical protein
MFVFHLDGSLFHHFPISVNIPFTGGGPIIADMDMDGDLELIGGTGGSLNVIDIKESGNNNNYWNMYRMNPRRNGLYTADSDLAVNSFNQFPKTFKISPAYPNPFNPIINIHYENPQISIVKVDVYDLRGRWIKNIVNTVHSPGIYELKWDAGSHSSGIYLLRYQILAGETKAQIGVKAEKIVLLK